MTFKTIGEGTSDAERAFEGAVAQVTPWQGRSIRYRPVFGGISNMNWCVSVGGEPGPFFLKMPGRGTEMFIDRAAARDASRRAQDLGIGPGVYDYLDAQDIEIHDFIEGRRPCTNADFLDPVVRGKTVDVYRILHQSGLFPLTKTVFDMIDEHVDQVRSLGGAAPPDFAWLMQQYRRARDALNASGLDLVPSFNDPMPGNFMLGADRSIMLIDYEYASNNDRCYDLGIWCGEMFFSGAIEDAIIERYFGRQDPAMKARLIVYKALADLKWSTWAMVQRKLSTLDFDFSKYGAWKHMRARSVMQDFRWPDYLNAV